MEFTSGEIGETSSIHASSEIRDDSATTAEEAVHRVRVVCISDTHGLHGCIPAENIPHGDILIHAGDFTSTGEQEHIASFMEWFGSQPHRYKILVAGNHDVTLHESYYETKGRNRFHGRKLQRYSVEECRNLVTSDPKVIYLEDSGVSLEFASTSGDGQHVKKFLRVWGSPWQPEFCDWAFNLNRGAECREKWDLIPEEVDILITHGPPARFGDLCENGLNAGCLDLLHTIQRRVRPQLHVSGHIHEGYGVACDKQGITYVNASTCTYRYRPTNPAIVVEVILKSELL
jgi:predicted phosphodiesterase